MKKLINNKGLMQKLIISILTILLLTFSVPIYSHAGLGGILLDPIFDLFATLGDAIVGGLQMFLVDGNFGSGQGAGLNLSPFLADKEEFKQNKNNEYEDWQDDGSNPTTTIKEEDLDSSYYIPVSRYSPDKIFSNKIPALDINFIQPKDFGVEQNKKSVARSLHETIAQWYVALRNFAVVGLMIVLLYVGIRIVISSTASDKAKYKQMLGDWLVALCILFCLHYIMSFTITIVNEVSDKINSSSNGSGNNISVKVDGTDGVNFKTDLMGLIRFKLQLNNGWQKLLYLIFYGAMVFYTCLFTFAYLKRVLIMAFLTFISPLVALTYPIDKMRDGKAQAFDMWFKEYIFNAMLQPFHLIIYTVFVSAATMDLAAENPIYAIITLAFITPAEKILRKFFGFDKAATSGALGTFAGVAGGAAAMNMMTKALGKGTKGKAVSSGKKDVRQKSNVSADSPELSEGWSNTGNSSEGEEIRTSENVEQSPNDSNNATTQGPELQPGEHNVGGVILSGNAWDEYNQPKVEPSNSTSDSINPKIDETPKSFRENFDNAKEKYNWSANEDDTRGAGQWLADKGRAIGSAVVNTAAGTKAGQVFVNKGRSVKDMATKIRSKGIATMNMVPKPIRNSARGALGVAKSVGKGALGVAGRMATAAPGAIVGLSAGIAGDELGDVLKFAGAGAALSAAALPGIGSSIKNSAASVANTYKEEAFGGTKGLIEQGKKNYVKSTEYDDYYKQKFHGENGRELTKSELKAKKVQGAYFNSIGIEGKDAVKAVALQDKIKAELSKEMPEESAENQARARAAVIAKYAKDYDTKDLRDATNAEGLRISIQKEFKKSGFDEKNSKEQSRQVLAQIKKFKGIKEE